MQTFVHGLVATIAQKNQQTTPLLKRVIATVHSGIVAIAAHTGNSNLKVFSDN